MIFRGNWTMLPKRNLHSSKKLSQPPSLVRHTSILLLRECLMQPPQRQVTNQSKSWKRLPCYHKRQKPNWMSCSKVATLRKNQLSVTTHSGFMTPTAAIKTPPNDSPKSVTKQQQVMGPSELIELVKALTQRDEKDKPKIKEAELTKLNNMPAPESYRTWKKTMSGMRSRVAQIVQTKLGCGLMKCMINRALAKSLRRNFKILGSSSRWMQSYQQRSRAQPEETLQLGSWTSRSNSPEKVSRSGRGTFLLMFEVAPTE